MNKLMELYRKGNLSEFRAEFDRILSLNCPEDSSPVIESTDGFYTPGVLFQLPLDFVKEVVKWDDVSHLRGDDIDDDAVSYAVFYIHGWEPDQLGGCSSGFTPEYHERAAKMFEEKIAYIQSVAHHPSWDEYFSTWAPSLPWYKHGVGWEFYVE